MFSYTDFSDYIPPPPHGPPPGLPKLSPFIHDGIYETSSAYSQLSYPQSPVLPLSYSQHPIVLGAPVTMPTTNSVPNKPNILSVPPPPPPPLPANPCRFTSSPKVFEMQKKSTARGTGNASSLFTSSFAGLNSSIGTPIISDQELNWRLKDPVNSPAGSVITGHSSVVASNSMGDDTVEAMCEDECSFGTSDEVIAAACFIKLLVTNQLAGMLIGTLGQEIKSIKDRTGAKIVLSPHGKYFPGTTERLVTMEGSETSVFGVVDWIVDKILDISLGDSSGQNQPTCKISVPRAVVGCLIGKNGSYIQSVRMATGAHVHVSPLFVSADEACAERIVTIQSRDRESLRAATFTVARKINEHPDRATCRNISYYRKNDFISDPYAESGGSTDTGTPVGSSAITPAENTLPNASMNKIPAPPPPPPPCGPPTQTFPYPNAIAAHAALKQLNQRTVLSSPVPPPVHSVVIGPPPGLEHFKSRWGGACVSRSSLGGASMDHQSSAGSTVYAAPPATRRYNREVSAESESTQCSLTHNPHSVTAISPTEMAPPPLSEESEEMEKSDDGSYVSSMAPRDNIDLEAEFQHKARSIEKERTSHSSTSFDSSNEDKVDKKLSDAGAEEEGQGIGTETSSGWKTILVESSGFYNIYIQSSFFVFFVAMLYLAVVNSPH